MRFVEVGIIDIEGQLRTRTFMQKLEEKLLKNGFGFDGSSLGIAPVEDSDLIAIPDPTTRKIFRRKNFAITFYLSSIHKDGETYAGCFRSLLSNYLEEYPYEPEVGVEIEFYVLGENNHNDNYMRPWPLDEIKLVKLEFINELERLDYDIEFEHAEVGANQHEITLGKNNPLKIADSITFFEYFAKGWFKEKGLEITFEPKPFPNLNGSGMHLHFSLKKDGKPISFLHDKEGRYFIGGVLHYCREIALATNQTINSYERLVPGFEAPCYISWGVGNRSALIRIPSYRKSDEYRFEFRATDPLANPYLAIAAILEAGKRGVEECIEPPPLANCNVYENKDFKTLPRSLKEALEEAKRGSILKDIMGGFLFKLLIKRKEEELIDEFEKANLK